MSTNQRSRILIVDDHPEMAQALGEQLADLGYATQIASSGADAIAAVRNELPDVVVTDLRMESLDGFDVLDAVKQVDASVPVLIMTAFGAIDSAVDAIKRGAFHYLSKPFQFAELQVLVERALADRRLRDENRSLKKELADRSSLGAMIGRSQPMAALYDLIQRVAPSSAPVLIRGESGTGKELVARALHHHGQRSGRPFVTVNCTALPEALLESELFGHTRGAFTGATSARRGLFVEADGGTLFLDEIGDMTSPLQAKLLRALDKGEIRPTGSDTPRVVDVRVVAATHQNLDERVQSGQFRADLFYRLNVITVRVPPLRDRRGDIPLLVDAFLAAARQRNPQSPVVGYSSEVMGKIVGYAWPGNVRELQNTVERLVIVGVKPRVDLAALEDHAPQLLEDTHPLTLAKQSILPLRKLEDDYIAWVMTRCAGNKTRAAELLQIDPSTIYRREREREPQK